ncbi:MAG: hypothetical protein IK082_04930, partial [Oscillospiraceae bacterium]|nr:hypothetical protein [Oscillospiraceae bacterium]
TDDGETQIETPEEGATFQIYLKASGSYEAAKESERDTLECDENGFAQSKDLPYGVYTVHQVSGWEGRELMKRIFWRIFLSKVEIKNQSMRGHLRTSIMNISLLIRGRI